MGMPVSAFVAVVRALESQGLKMIGIPELNAMNAALSPCFEQGYLDGVNGWPLVAADKAEDSEVSGA